MTTTTTASGQAGAARLLGTEERPAWQERPTAGDPGAPRAARSS